MSISKGVNILSKLNVEEIKPMKIHLHDTRPISIIDKYGLGDYIRQLRAKGLSYLSIAKEINKQPEMKGKPIAPQIVSSWGKANIEEQMSVTKRDEIINTYNENKKLLTAVENQMTLLEVFLDDLSQEVLVANDVATLYKRMQELNKDYEKYINRKQSILQQIQLLQDKVYNLQTLSEIVQEVLETVRRISPEIYEEVVSDMKSNKVLLSAYEKVMDFETKYTV